VDELVKRKTYLGENMKTVYSLIWGQCTDVMRQRVEAMSNFNQLSSNGNRLDLLMAIIKDLVVYRTPRVKNTYRKPCTNRHNESTVAIKANTCQHKPIWNCSRILWMPSNTVEVHQLGTIRVLMSIVMTKKCLTPALTTNNERA
jgi:hypothetical protein